MRTIVRRKIGVRDQYAKLGIAGYYKEHAGDYKNPHELQVRELLKRSHKRFAGGRMLDLACGSGEVTAALLELGYHDIVGLDPYTCSLYEQRTQKNCLPLSFEDILAGKLAGQFSTIICSFGLHLAEESKLPKIVVELCKHTSTVVIITPHKRPALEKYGLKLIHEDAVETEKGKKVRLKIYSAGFSSAFSSTSG